MRISTPFLALGAIVLATPAAAQLGVNLGGQGGVNVGGNVGVGTNVGGTLDGMTGTVDRTVSKVDRTANGALASDLRLATAADLRTGAQVRDNRGHKVGILQSVQGNSAVVVSGGRMLHVPLASLYRRGKGLVTGLSRAQIEAGASADVDASASARAND